MATTQTPDTKVLASGRIAHTDERGRATLATCPWLVLVLSGHPEPDSPSDLYTEVDCGAPLFALDGDLEAGWFCSNGHEHLTYGSPRQQAQERQEALVELTASTNPRIAARLDSGETWQEVLAR